MAADTEAIPFELNLSWITEITSAFMSFLTHYDVFPEPELKSIFQRAAIIARLAPHKLVEAKQLEEALARGDGWNRASWTVWGGTYGSAERGGLEKESNSWDTQPPPDVGITDDGGWTVDPSKHPISDRVGSST